MDVNNFSFECNLHFNTTTFYFCHNQLVSFTKTEKWFFPLFKTDTTWHFNVSTWMFYKMKKGVCLKAKLFELIEILWRNGSASDSSNICWVIGRLRVRITSGSNFFQNFFHKAIIKVIYIVTINSIKNKYVNEIYF